MALSAVRPLSSLSLAVFWWVLTRLLRLLVKYLSPTTSTVIIRVAREHYRTLWAALTLLRKVGGHECIARVVHVSGKEKSAKPSAVRSLNWQAGADSTPSLCLLRRPCFLSLRNPTSIGPTVPYVPLAVRRPPLGTIRKTQHSAIAHDRTQILLLAAAAASSRQRRRKRQLQQTASSSSSSFPSPLNATTAAADTKANEEAGDDEVRRLLGESEARIRAMEA